MDAKKPMSALQLQRHLKDGASPPGSVVLDANSDVHGTAFCGAGVVFEISLTDFSTTEKNHYRMRFPSGLKQ